MSNTQPPVYGGQTSTTSGTADVAKEQAGQLGHQTADAGRQVGSVAKGEAKQVASEAKNQAKELFSEARTQLGDQASQQQQRVASGIRTLGQQLSSMADNDQQGGMAKDLVGQVASRAEGVASWLDQRDPGSLIEEVKYFARRRPGTFIGIAAVAGVLAGRLTKSITSAASDADTGTQGAEFTTPAYATEQGFGGYETTGADYTGTTAGLAGTTGAADVGGPYVSTGTTSGGLYSDPAEATDGVGTPLYDGLATPESTDPLGDDRR